MPKLHRSTVVVGGGGGGGGGAGLSIQLPKAFHQQPHQPVRQLSLPFSFTTPGRDNLISSGIHHVTRWVDAPELTDDILPLESRRFVVGRVFSSSMRYEIYINADDLYSYYHGSISRKDAEMRLKPEPAGTFLVRDSLASRHDYFLAAR